MSEAGSLHNKTLAMIVGPSAIGKDSVINEMTEVDSRFQHVRSFTTRQPRQGEQSHYIFVDKPGAERMIETGEALTHIVHPTTGDIYGSTEESYPGEFTILDTLSGSVANFRKLPFLRTVTMGLTADANEWRKWFVTRYPSPTEEAVSRLEEAKISIQWALGDSETHWLRNKEGALREVAKKSIALTTAPPKAIEIPEEPYEMLELIKRGPW